MSRIAIHGRKFSSESAKYIQDIVHIIRENGRDLCISPELAAFSTDLSFFRELPTYQPGADMNQFEAIFSLGGDGTLLETLTHVGSTVVPILGVNLGRLGFLATISRENIREALMAYFQGKYIFDDRTLLELNTQSDLFKGKNYALNEFAILRKDTSSMIVVRCYLDGEYLNTYWADGLMVATPTGSTGYSLSCGGPIIIPNTKTFIVTPVSPHNLNVRPLIVSEDSEITIEVESQNQSHQLSLDSRSVAMSDQAVLKIRKAAFPARLIKVEGSSFLDTLRTKLTWGLDKRN